MTSGIKYPEKGPFEKNVYRPLPPCKCWCEPILYIFFTVTMYLGTYPGLDFDKVKTHYNRDANLES